MPNWTSAKISLGRQDVKRKFHCGKEKLKLAGAGVPHSPCGSDSRWRFRAYCQPSSPNFYNSAATPMIALAKALAFDLLSRITVLFRVSFPPRYIGSR